MNTAVKMLETASFEATQVQATNAVLMIFGILALSLVIFSYVSSRLVKPLIELSKRFATVESGELSDRAEVSGNDEVATTLRHYNSMLDQVVSLFKEIIDNAVTIGKHSEALSKAASESAQGLQHQYTEIEQISSAINQMSATFKDVSSKIVIVAKDASQADEDANSARKVVKETSLSIIELHGEVRQVVAVIDHLSTDSLEISKVLDVINGIAEQTNLLALNAAIEAARAGENGRGFAVVADEVRALAGRTASSTLEIRTMIESLQQQSNQAVSAIEKSEQRAENGVNQSKITDEAIQRIADAVASIHDMNTQIAAAAEQQSRVVEEINHNIVKVAEFSENSYVNSENNTKMAQQISATMNKLHNLVKAFNF